MVQKLKKINNEVYFIETGPDSVVGEDVVKEKRQVNVASVQLDIDNAMQTRADLQTKIAEWSAMKGKITAFIASADTEQVL